MAANSAMGQAVSATTTTSAAPMAWRLPLKEMAKPPPARTASKAWTSVMLSPT